MTSQTIYVPSKKVVCRDIMGEKVIVPIEAGIADFNDAMYALNETGSLVWEGMEKKKTMSQICSAIAMEFDVERSTVEKDVIYLVDTLLEKELITLWEN